MKENKCTLFVRIFLLVVLCVFICACSREEAGPNTVVYNGALYTIDDEAMTISDGTHTYRYEGRGNGSSYSYTIYYPNGSSYYWTWSGNIGHGGWSDDYDENLYTEGRILMNVLETQMPEESEPKNIILIIFLLIVGGFNAVAPQTSWYLSEGWKYKNLEPSETALDMTRIVGVIAIVIAVFMMIA